MCTAARIVYTIPLITGIYQITVVSHSVHILTYVLLSYRLFYVFFYVFPKCLDIDSVLIVKVHSRYIIPEAFSMSVKYFREPSFEALVISSNELF